MKSNYTSKELENQVILAIKELVKEVDTSLPANEYYEQCYQKVYNALSLDTVQSELYMNIAMSGECTYTPPFDDEFTSEVEFKITRLWYWYIATVDQWGIIITYNFTNTPYILLDVLDFCCEAVHKF